MPIADSLITWIYLLAASIWIGGSIFIGIVLFSIHVKISSISKEQLLANGNSDSKVTKLHTKIIWIGRIIVWQSVAILLFAALLDTGI